MRALRRKVLRQLPGHRLDAADHAALELPRPELDFHGAADALPTLGANLRIDTAIGDDLDIAVGEQEIDQDAVVVRGVPDAQLREHVERALARRLVAKQRAAIERAFDHEANLPGMHGFAALDRLLDAVEHVFRKHLPGTPMMLEQMPGDAPDAHDLPAPRGAAAAKTAATTAEAAARRRPAAPAAG